MFSCPSEYVSMVTKEGEKKQDRGIKLNIYCELRIVYLIKGTLGKDWISIKPVEVYL